MFNAPLYPRRTGGTKMPTLQLDLWGPLVLQAHLVLRAMPDRLVLLARAWRFA
jgi:hypothetical protein